MSRRGFLKWLTAAAAVVAASFYALFQLLTRFGTKTPPPAAADIVVPVHPEPAHAQEAKPVVSAEPLLSFFVLSDLHISIYDESTPRKLRMALDDIVKLESKVDAILFGGDLTDYSMESEYKSFEAILKEYKLPPYYANMGNHDYYGVWIDKNGGFNRDAFPNGKTDAQSRARFQKLFGYAKPYHDVLLNGYHVILMSQEAYAQEKPEVGEGAWYSDEQLEWLKAKLKETKDGKPIIVLIHQPLPPEGQDGGSHRLIRAKEFREALKPYKNVFVISGHTHQDYENGSSHYSKETFHWFMNASVGRTRTQGGKEKSQGLYVQVYEDRVVLRGREFTTRSFIEAANWTVPLERAKV
ncbi:metallophosphoesterase family protein [Paenibacillus flagellatus]|uniref:Phosphohydrolase n=1 Tax=Paenibacillus flagellatus TaxID=2211139 RepID=A0A2V5KAM3_9BACL|nr:metallophosphoesterase [Paenibacillus flagellatus]PYI50870.1 phosphohydrolase [Paenibacillus flagellatus]